MLQLFKIKYGDSYTEHLEKFRQEVADSMSKNSIYPYLDDNVPFSSVDETEWNGNVNIHLKLNFIQERNLIILSVEEYLDKIFHSNSRNWVFESNYNENFTNAFKEFDNKNGYKRLKFGMQKSAVKNIVKFKDADVLRQYAVTTQEYKNWFYIPFDFCYLMFNKKNELYEVSLSKDEYSDEDYRRFLKELIEMFGTPTTYEEKSGNSEFTLWSGRNIFVTIMRPQDHSLYVYFDCGRLDDSSPTDKLY